MKVGSLNGLNQIKKITGNCNVLLQSNNPLEIRQEIEKIRTSTDHGNRK
jgi:hypothetical protein